MNSCSLLKIFNRSSRTLLPLLFFLLIGVSEGFAQLKTQQPLWPTVGATTELVDVILPGPRLIGKPIDDRDPVIVRVTDAIAHGDGFRYRIEYQGMEPGNFDLAKWLVRKDSMATGELPSIPVQIRSLLPPGQIQPNELTIGWLPSMGGYNILIVALAVLWTLGLLGLIFLGRKREPVATPTAAPATLAAMLKQRIEAACEDQAGSKELAEIERMLTAYWQKKLNLESESPYQGIVKIRQHPDSGPLMQQLETWIHRPNSETDVDWQALLAPYRDLPADSLDENSPAEKQRDGTLSKNRTPEQANAIR